MLVIPAFNMANAGRATGHNLKARHPNAIVWRGTPPARYAARMPSAPEPADVVIMGAGAAGALFAARLAGAGKRVVVLDAGPGWKPGDLASSQIWSRRLKWGGAPVERAGADPVGHNMAVGWGIGGSALHHYAGWARLQPEDFRLRAEHGVGRDWPIGYDDLRPHYDAIQAEMGIAGDAAEEVWRPPGAPYSLPPLKYFRQGALLKAGFQAIGMRVAPAPTAVTSVEWKGRPACQYDGWCDAGCPIGALANPHVLHIPVARARGAEFRARSTVTGFAIEAGRVIGLRYADAHGTEHVQRARRTILAGAAVQNARLLLAAGGLDDRSGMIGRAFLMHALSNAYGLFAEETQCHLGLSAGALTSQDHYAKAQAGKPLGAITYTFAPALKPNDLLGVAMTRPDLFGAPLAAFTTRASKHLGVVSALVESLPNNANRVELSASRDAHGVPLARVVHSYPAVSAALWNYANATAKRAVVAAGAREAWIGPQRVYSHPAGGTIMGGDPRRSVTDSFGRLWGAPEVMIAGGGLFPSIGAVGPTFTVLALADRAAAHLLAAWA